MKLNNNGWGMKEMAIFMSILLAFLLIAVYNVNRLYRSIENTQNNLKNTKVVEKKKEEQEEPIVKEEPVDYVYYSSLERKFKQATLNYLENYNYDLSSEILKVSYDTLEGLDFLELKDQFGNNTCDGYSNVYYDTDTEEYVVKSYIRCKNYTSEGY